MIQIGMASKQQFMSFLAYATLTKFTIPYLRFIDVPTSTLILFNLFQLMLLTNVRKKELGDYIKYVALFERFKYTCNVVYAKQQQSLNVKAWVHNLCYSASLL